MYSDNWDGDVYKGARHAQRRSSAAARGGANRAACAAAARNSCRSRSARRAGSGFNVLNLVIVAFVLTPVLGLAFAYWSYGTLWG